MEKIILLYLSLCQNPIIFFWTVAFINARDLKNLTTAEFLTFYYLRHFDLYFVSQGCLEDQFLLNSETFRHNF